MCVIVHIVTINLLLITIVGSVLTRRILTNSFNISAQAMLSNIIAVYLISCDQNNRHLKLRKLLILK